MTESQSDGVVSDPEITGGIVDVQAIPRCIAAAIVQAQIACAAAIKDGTNKHHDYGYASAEQRITLGKAALNSAGLALLPFSWARIPGEPYDVMMIRWLLVHESGPSLELQTQTAVIPQGGRPMDKAEATAQTYATGYLYRLVCAIPNSDKSEDVDQRDDTKHQEPTPRPRRETRPKATASNGLTPRQVVNDLRKELGWEDHTAITKLAELNGLPTSKEWTAKHAATLTANMRLIHQIEERAQALELGRADLDGIVDFALGAGASERNLVLKAQECIDVITYMSKMPSAPADEAPAGGDYS